MTRRIRLVGSTAIALAALPALAHAAGSLTTVTARASLGDDGRATATAVCSDNQSAVSGGVKALPVDGSNPQVPQLIGQRNVGWKATFDVNGDIGGSGSVTSYAYCRREPIKFESNRFNSTRDAYTVQCPRGRKALSGGYLLSGIADGFQVGESRRKGKRSWRVTLPNLAPRHGVPGSFSVIVQVNCHRGPAPIERAKSATGNEPSPAARCHRGERVVAAGFKVSDPSQHYLWLSAKDGPRRWETQWMVSGFGPPVKATTYAYCEEK